MATVFDRLTFPLALALLLAAGVAYADERPAYDDDDHEQARHALEEGQVRPLADVLAGVRGQIEGEVVGVEFERRDGRYIYEFKVITPAGRLREVRVDAMSAEIMTGAED